MFGQSNAAPYEPISTFQNSAAVADIVAARLGGNYGQILLPYYLPSSQGLEVACIWLLPVTLTAAL